MRGAALSDVPTIVPIVLSLVLFFSSVVWAINRVNDVNGDIQLALDSVRLAETFTQTAYVTPDLWNKFCDAAKTQFPGRRFLVAITTFDEWKDVKNPVTWISGKLGNPSGLYVCARGERGEIERARRIVVHAFPILVQEQGGSVPKNELNVLVVGIWQGA